MPEDDGYGGVYTYGFAAMKHPIYVSPNGHIVLSRQGSDLHLDLTPTPHGAYLLTRDAAYAMIAALMEAFPNRRKDD